MPAPRKHPLELRERAVRMYRTAEPKPVIRRMAEELGVHHEALRNWIRQADAGERGGICEEARGMAARRDDQTVSQRAPVGTARLSHREPAACWGTHTRKAGSG